MKRIVFSCSENMNEHEEVFEFENEVTDAEIEDEFREWVWNEIGDTYSWYPEGEK